MRKLLWGFAVVITASIIIIACQKGLSSPQDINTKFDDKAAKEWYYGTFKKSPEYAGYNAAMSGKKLPDWKNNKSIKFGNYQVVDFPLVKQKSSVAFPASSGLTDADKRRVAEASFSRMAFIKNSAGKIDVREVLFIPDMDYLVRHNYDISANSFAQMDKDYSGLLVVKKWDGDEISTSIISNGKIIKRLKKHNANTTIREGRTADIVCIIEWARDCGFEEHGDQAATWECGEWYPTGNQWCWDDGQSPPEEDPCLADPGSPQCGACALYGIGCEDPGGDPEEENCEVRQLDLQGSVQSEIESTITTNETPTIREKDYEWVIYKQLVNLWRVKSKEHGIHVQVNNVWQWQSFTHMYISKTGTIFGGNISVTELSSHADVGIYWASMQVTYKVEPSLVCAGSPFSASEDFTSVLYRNVND